MGMRVGVAVKAPKQRHQRWVSCLRGKHGGRLPTRRQQPINASVRVWQGVGRQTQGVQPLVRIVFLFFFRSLISRMKQFSSRLSHRDRGNGRRGEAKEAGGRQSKGRGFSLWGCQHKLSDTSTGAVKWSFHVVAHFISSVLSVVWCPYPLSVAPSQLSDPANTRPALTAGVGGGWQARRGCQHSCGQPHSFVMPDT